MDKTKPASPWNPSQRAIARVKDPLPTPCACPHCGGDVALVNNAAIYGTSYGDWPWAYLCTKCGAYVGLHPFTAIPLGTLATKDEREARKRAKAALTSVWCDGGAHPPASPRALAEARTRAYTWLAGELGIPVGQCHIGWFGVEQCAAVVKAVKSYEAAKCA